MVISLFVNGRSSLCLEEFMHPSNKPYRQLRFYPLPGNTGAIRLRRFELCWSILGVRATILERITFHAEEGLARPPLSDSLLNDQIRESHLVTNINESNGPGKKRGVGTAHGPAIPLDGHLFAPITIPRALPVCKRLLGRKSLYGAARTLEGNEGIAERTNILPTLAREIVQFLGALLLVLSTETDRLVLHFGGLRLVLAGDTRLFQAQKAQSEHDRQAQQSTMGHGDLLLLQNDLVMHQELPSIQKRPQNILKSLGARLCRLQVTEGQVLFVGRGLAAERQ